MPGYDFRGQDVVYHVELDGRGISGICRAVSYDDGDGSVVTRVSSGANSPGHRYLFFTGRDGIDGLHITRNSHGIMAYELCGSFERALEHRRVSNDRAPALDLEREIDEGW